MADTIDMSLDDIITKSRTAKKSTNTGGRRGGAVRNNQNNRSSGRGGSAPYAKGGKPQQQQQQQPIRLTTEKLAVSNLAHSVSEADVRELFKQIGPLRSATLNYNAEGKSKGVANVVFARPGDAAKAVKEYNNRTFDGRAMRLELVVSADAVAKAVPATSRLGAPVNKPQQQQQKQQGNRGSASGRGGRSGRGKGRGGARGNKPKTQEELDAELEGYMNDQDMEDAGGVSAELANAL